MEFEDRNAVIQQLNNVLAHHEALTDEENKWIDIETWIKFFLEVEDEDEVEFLKREFVNNLIYEIEYAYFYDSGTSRSKLLTLASLKILKSEKVTSEFYQDNIDRILKLWNVFNNYLTKLGVKVSLRQEDLTQIDLLGKMGSIFWDYYDDFGRLDIKEIKSFFHDLFKIFREFMEGNINSEMLRNKPELERLQKIVNERLRDARISIDHYSHIVDEAKKVAHELNIPLNQITYRFELPKK